MESKYNLHFLLVITVLFLVVGVNAQAPDATPFKPANYTTAAKSYIRAWDVKAGITDPVTLTLNTDPQQALVTSSYLDGLGRPIQMVTKKGSMKTGAAAYDLVTAMDFDGFGRDVRKYLPFGAINSDGQFKANPFEQQANFYNDIYNGNNPIKGQGEIWLYGRTHFESSPLNRASETFAPGNSWVGTHGNAVESQRKSVKTKYWVNTTIDVVRIWNVQDQINAFGIYSSPGIYSAGELYKNATTDEDGKQVIEFKDKEGKLILKKMQLTAAPEGNGSGSGHSGWLCTYYIYDNLGQLRSVIQPKAVAAMNDANNWTLGSTALDELCFRYEYDGRGRMIIKKVPGAGEVFLVYDKRDRLTMTQDANMRTGAVRWLVTIYDQLNRATKTGVWTNAQTRAYHQAAAEGATDYYPFNSEPASNWELFTETHYDDYTGIPSSLSGSLNASGFSNYLTESSASPYYAESVNASAQVKGLVTWTRVKVLNETGFIETSFVYDMKGRVIQTQTKNYTGSLDVVTSQYNFSGQVVRSHVLHQKGGTNPQSYQIGTRNVYDELGRLSSIEKNINGGGWKSIAALEYDAVGQLKKKKLSPASNGGNGLESLTYDYNIRGWMLGANRDYAKNVSSTNYFGFDLGYDKTTIGSLGSYAAAQYNGNINGTVWRSKGDGEVRKYDFSYDAVNRLTGANFNQYTSSAFSKAAGIDFSVSGLAYDANGNISSMSQKGWKITGSATIDSLSYGYNTNSNRLNYVTDKANDANSKLGDFKEITNNSSQDYSYDSNGNLTLDNNKAISGISYNHLNLPATITVSGKGSITYTYDAAGNKLKKVTTEGSKVTTTLYLYGNYVNDTLQYLPQEEGRIRKKTDGTFTYDYFLKDHLGNVRMVLTEEQQTNYYPAATLEGSTTSGALSMVNWEKQFYTIDNTKITSTSAITGWSSSFNYPNNNGNPPYNSITSGSYPSNYTVNDGSTSINMYKTNANSNKTALGFVIKVMAGDVVDIFGKSYYYAPGTSFTNSNSSSLLVSDIFNAFLGSGGNPASGKGVTEPNLETLNSNSYSLPSNLIRGSDGTTSSSPKAYINYILFDEQFRNVGSGFSRVGTSGTVKSHWGDPTMQNITVPKNGYIYVYVSNESNQDVFFDNLQVVHKRGPILEETHYYPFGLTMAGISSKAAGGIQNRYKYNGIELNNDLEISSFEAFYRNLDPQIGRFWQIDPQVEMLESYSPYESMGNNPISNIDPLGDFKTRFGAWWHSLWNGGGKIGQNEFGEWYILKTSASSTEDGNVTVTAHLNYGKGRWRELAQREKMVEEIERDQRVDELIRMGAYERVSPEEARQNTLILSAGLLFPNIIKAGTVAANSINSANKIDNLLDAGNVLDRGGLTKAGRALQKHGSRSGSAFPKVNGSAASINSQAEEVLNGILTNSNVEVVSRYHARFGNIIEYKIPGGQGARFSADSKKFIGFIEP